ncbi:MAG: DNA polymerase III subunit beta [Firmicutes bacterium]|nr:DNA polymerase III subunit beta [Bacillota bacterium]
MHISCNKTTLLNAINFVIKPTSTKTTKPITNCIYINADRGGLKLISNNYDISIETDYIESEIYSKGSVAIDSKRFESIIRSLPEGIIDIKVDDKFLCDIKLGKFESKLKGMDPKEFPMPVEVLNVEEPVVIKEKTLKNMINKTIFAVATDNNRPILKGELLKLDGGVFSIVAIDGFRVAWRMEDIGVKGYNEIVVPGETMKIVQSLLGDNEDEVQIYSSSRNVKFIINGSSVVSSLLEGVYINYENLFKIDSPINLNVETKLLSSAVERTKLMYEDSKVIPIEIKVENENLNIRTESDYGDINEDIEVKGEGEISIKFNTKYLSDILKAIDEEYICLNMNTEKSPCIITGIYDESYKYFILPINSK